MATRKKDISLVILETLEKFVHTDNPRVEVVEHDKYLLYLRDKDVNSDFFFIIDKCSMVGSDAMVSIMRKPKNEKENTSTSHSTKIDNLDKHFDAWITILRRYDKVETFFDDPILNSFKEEYYAEFNFVDDETSSKPLNSSQILLIDEYFENVQKALPEYVNENNKEDLEEIINDIDSLRQNLTVKTKKWVGEKISIIWAKLTKQGAKFIKDFVVEGKKQIIQQVVKGLIMVAKDNFEQFG